MVGIQGEAQKVPGKSQSLLEARLPCQNNSNSLLLCLTVLQKALQPIINLLEANMCGN